MEGVNFGQLRRGFIDALNAALKCVWCLRYPSTALAYLISFAYRRDAEVNRPIELNGAVALQRLFRGWRVRHVLSDFRCDLCMLGACLDK